MNFVKVKDREPAIGDYYYCMVDTKQDNILKTLVEWSKLSNGNYDWDLKSVQHFSGFREDAEVIAWLDESQIDSDSISIIIDKVSKMKDDSGRTGCTYGDTEHDSISACYGYNLAILHVVKTLIDFFKPSTVGDNITVDKADSIQYSMLQTPPKHIWDVDGNDLADKSWVGEFGFDTRGYEDGRFDLAFKDGFKEAMKYVFVTKQAQAQEIFESEVIFNFDCVINYDEQKANIINAMNIYALTRYGDDLTGLAQYCIDNNALIMTLANYRGKADQDKYNADFLVQKFNERKVEKKEKENYVPNVKIEDFPQSLVRYALVEVFADNGQHSHWSLVKVDDGVKVWSENPEECSAMGYPVKPVTNIAKSDFDELIACAKYGYEYHATTSFPKESFDTYCLNNTKQWIIGVLRKKDLDSIQHPDFNIPVSKAKGIEATNALNLDELRAYCKRIENNSRNYFKAWQDTENEKTALEIKLFCKQDSANDSIKPLLESSSMDTPEGKAFSKAITGMNVTQAINLLDAYDTYRISRIGKTKEKYLYELLPPDKAISKMAKAYALSLHLNTEVAKMTENHYFNGAATMRDSFAYKIEKMCQLIDDIYEFYNSVETTVFEKGDELGDKQQELFDRMRVFANKIPYTHSENQCDGCNAGYPVDEHGIHRVPYPSGSMVCQKDKYDNKKELVKLDNAVFGTKQTKIKFGESITITINNTEHTLTNYLCSSCGNRYWISKEDHNCCPLCSTTYKYETEFIPKTE